MHRTLAPITLSFVLVLAASAAGQTGGTESGGAPAPTGGQVATVSDGAITLSARSDAILGRVARFRGKVAADRAGRTVAVERHDPKTERWVVEARTKVRRDGSFLARWRTDHIGRFRLRAHVDGSGAHAAAASPELAVTIYKPAKATWYGPGFYGRTTACGQRMSRALVGVAHRTLPCGARVAIYYGGRTLTVPVVDRGPFRRGVHWDLTYAAATALGFEYTDVIAAVRLREPAPAK